MPALSVVACCVSRSGPRVIITVAPTTARAESSVTRPRTTSGADWACASLALEVDNAERAKEDDRPGSGSDASKDGWEWGDSSFPAPTSASPAVSGFQAGLDRVLGN